MTVGNIYTVVFDNGQELKKVELLAETDDQYVFALKDGNLTLESPVLKSKIMQYKDMTGAKKYWYADPVNPNQFLSMELTANEAKLNKKSLMTEAQAMKKAKEISDKNPNASVKVELDTPYVYLNGTAKQTARFKRFANGRESYTD